MVLVWCWGWSVAYAQYHVVALRVEFQTDTTRFTTGDGTFDGLRWPTDLTVNVDPLPHDAEYFEAHLAFLRDYVGKVSDGQASVTTWLVPEVFRVAHTMGAYSPVGQDADGDTERAKLVSLVVEAWIGADGISPLDLTGLDPERIFFVLFHAGIGRDVELLGTVLEKTPLDIPSLYFGPDELARLGAGTIIYGGVEVSNSAIIPRTESRMGYNSIVQDSLLLELSINGLLASSFLSFLGVPDLFNTATGETAIGGFGLMDPQGIFAYAGLFPPAPTAWTRQHLGWLQPQLLTGPRTVYLSDGEAARVEISDAEYFLIENRQRDPDHDGLMMRVWHEGQVTTQRIDSLTDDFHRYSVNAFAGGVVVGVDDYDFALPGRDADGQQYPGGILIWHIDERVIRTGQVNANPAHRGVDLEEADAAQDLGYDNSPGSPFDFFYEGNDVRAVLPSGREIRFYENRFGPSTMPSSAANNGGESFIMLSDFSKPGVSMSFTYALEELHGIIPAGEVDLGTAMPDGSSVGGGPDFAFVYTPGTPGDVVVVANGAVHHLASYARPVVNGNQIVLLQASSAPGTFVIRVIAVPGMEVVQEHRLPGVYETVHGPLVMAGEGTVHALFADVSASILVSVGADRTINTQSFPGGDGHVALSPEQGVLVVGPSYVASTDGRILWRTPEAGTAVFASDAGGVWGVLTESDGRMHHMLLPGGEVHSLAAADVLARESHFGQVTLADVDADGMHEVITTAGAHLLALERSGAVVPGYPRSLDAPLIGWPLVVGRNTAPETVVIASSDGLVHAVSGGRVVAGFPLSTGNSISGTPRLLSGRLEVATSTGVLRTYSWTFSGEVLWGEQHQDSFNSSLAVPTVATPSTSTDRLIVEEETYNWPNPVRHGSTRVRLMTTEDAHVTITIVDLAGTMVHEFTGKVSRGLPAEFVWEAAVESGVYFARIRAANLDGRTDTHLVRIGVIR